MRRVGQPFRLTLMCRANRRIINRREMYEGILALIISEVIAGFSLGTSYEKISYGVKRLGHQGPHSRTQEHDIDC